MSTDEKHAVDEAKPAPPAAILNLDALEREGGTPEPFTFQHENRTYTMIGPQDIDWQDLISGLRNPALFIRFAMTLDDQKVFFGSRVPGWKMNALMDAYNTHFGIPDVGNASALRT